VPGPVDERSLAVSASCTGEGGATRASQCASCRARRADAEYRQEECYAFDASKTGWVWLSEGARAVQDAEHDECEKTPSCRARAADLRSRGASSTKSKK
jgi:hypothetical protein